MNGRSTSDTHRGLRSYLQADEDVGTLAPAARPPAAALPEGAVPAPEPHGFDPQRVGLTASLPADVALLCVTDTTWEGRPRLALTWHFRGAVRVAPQEQVSVGLESSDLDLSLSKLVQNAAGARNGKGWREAYYEAMTWWLAENRLTEWLRDLLSAPRSTTTHRVGQHRP